MSVDPEILHERFSELADRAVPRGRLDVERAVADGRRSLARRRRARGAAAVSAVAIAGAAAAFCAGLPNGAGSAVAISSASKGGWTSFPRTADDPVAVGVSFGWLPSGLYVHTPVWPSETNVKMAALMDEADSDTTPGTAPRPGAPERGITLYTAPPGAMPQPLEWEGVDHESDTAGPSIGGEPSWIETPRDGYYGPEGIGALVWKLPNGYWAVLDFVDGADKGHGSGIFSTANVIRIAQGVTENPAPVAVPFHLEGALAQAELTAVQSSSTNGTNLIQPDYWLTLTLREGEAQIVVTFRYTAQNNALAGQACTHEDPQIAVMACVAVHGTLPPALAPSGAEGLLDDIELLTAPTTAVLR